MTVKLEFKGSDIDEAVKAACRRFGVDRGALDIDVVSTGSTGILVSCVASRWFRLV